MQSTQVEKICFQGIFYVFLIRVELPNIFNFPLAEALLEA